MGTQDDDRASTLGPEAIASAAAMCLAAYDPVPAAEGWRTLSLADLGVPASLWEGMHYVNRNGAAFVSECSSGGERVLAVVFRGTDPASAADWADSIAGINRHYALMAPLVRAVDDYVAAHGIRKVVATGHSMGGAMAELYMDAHRSGGVSYAGCTFGSPGARFPAGTRDARVLEFRHSEDIVPKAGALPVLGGYSVPGRTVTMEDEARHCGIRGLLKAHSMAEYVGTVGRMLESGALETVARAERDVEVPEDCGSAAGAPAPADRARRAWREACRPGLPIAADHARH